jgi:hypothetical protein
MNTQGTTAGWLHDRSQPADFISGAGSGGKNAIDVHPITNSEPQCVALPGRAVHSRWAENLPHPRSAMFRLHSIIIVTILGAGLSGCALNSRSPTEVMVYHGRGDSRAVTYEIGTDHRTLTGQRQLDLSLPEGARVCLDVMNAHTPFFSYDLRTAVDSSSPKPPEFGNVLTILNAAVTTQSSVSGSRSEALTEGRPRELPNSVASPRAGEMNLLRTPEMGTFESVYLAYKERVDTLEADVRRARNAVLHSVQPEDLRPTEVIVVKDQQRGLSYAQRSIDALNAEPGRFNDPKLASTVEAWQSRALGQLGGDAASDMAQLMVNSLHARSVTLLAARNALRETYGRASLHWRDCRAIGRGKTTIALGVRPRDTTQYALQRDTGSIFSVIATSDYPRNIVELVPLAFVAFPSNVTGFGIENDVVVEDVKYADDASVRIGTMLTTTPFRFGSASEWALGPGIGTGIIGDDKPALSDFFLGALVSWRDWIRLGAGYGFSEAPLRLRDGAQVGQRLPLSEGRESLDDFVEKKRVGTWFLSFTLSGLKLKS